MKSKLRSSLLVPAMLALFALNSELSTALAQGSAFSYQGQLYVNGGAADGSYDLTFTLYTNSSGGLVTAGPVTNLATAVSNGLFTARIDFGADAFTGSSNWVQIGVRTNGAAIFSPLTPLQQILPTPYAIYASNASTAASANSVAAADISGRLGTGQLPGAVVTNGQTDVTLSGTFSGNGTNLTDLNADNLLGGTVPLARLTNITSTQLAAATWQQATNLNGGNAAMASNVVSGIGITNAYLTNAVITNSVFAGNGGGLTNLNASQLSGLLLLASLPAGVVTNGEGGVTLGGTFSGNGSGLASVSAALASNVVSGIGITNGHLTNALITNSVFAGNGAGLTNLNASNFTSGVISLALLPAVVVTNRNGGDAALASNVVSGIAITNAVVTNSVFAGNGGGLTNLNASALTSIGNSNGGRSNFFVGSSGNATTTGSSNTAEGALALFRNTTGTGNAAVGASALASNTTGSFNIALGYQAGNAITTGSSNIDIGSPGVAGDVNTIRIGIAQDNVYLGGSFTPYDITLRGDRHGKENFSPVDVRAVLEQVASLPLTEWNDKQDNPARRHIGPMAQDFQAAFGLHGADDKCISVVDETGVALAAIQGLNRKLEEKEAEIEKLKEKADKVDALEKQLNELKLMVQSLAEKK